MFPGVLQYVGQSRRKRLWKKGRTMDENKPLTISALRTWLEKVEADFGNLPIFLHDEHGESEKTIEHFQVAWPKSPYLSHSDQTAIAENGEVPPWVKLSTYPMRVRIMAKR